MRDLGYVPAMTSPVRERPLRRDGRVRSEPMDWLDNAPERGVQVNADGAGVNLWVGFGNEFSVTSFPLVFSSADARDLAVRLNESANKADGLGHPTISWV